MEAITVSYESSLVFKTQPNYINTGIVIYMLQTSEDTGCIA